MNIKWGSGFKYSKKGCGHNKFWNGTQPFSRVCRKCRKINTPTQNTIFHGVKFPLNKAFKIIFDIYFFNVKRTYVEISEHYNINKNTVILFVKKLNKQFSAIKNHETPLFFFIKPNEIDNHNKGFIMFEVESEKKIRRFYNVGESSPLIQGLKNQIALQKNWSVYLNPASNINKPIYKHNAPKIFESLDEILEKTKAFTSSVSSFMNTISFEISEDSPSEIEHTKNNHLQFLENLILN